MARVPKPRKDPQTGILDILVVGNGVGWSGFAHNRALCVGLFFWIGISFLFAWMVRGDKEPTPPLVVGVTYGFGCGKGCGISSWCGRARGLGVLSFRGDEWWMNEWIYLEGLLFVVSRSKQKSIDDRALPEISKDLWLGKTIAIRWPSYTHTCISIRQASRKCRWAPFKSNACSCRIQIATP